MTEIQLKLPPSPVSSLNNKVWHGLSPIHNQKMLFCFKVLHGLWRDFLSVWRWAVFPDTLSEDEGTCEESKPEALNLSRDFIQLVSSRGFKQQQEPLWAGQGLGGQRQSHGHLSSRATRAPGPPSTTTLLSPSAFPRFVSRIRLLHQINPLEGISTDANGEQCEATVQNTCFMFYCSSATARANEIAIHSELGYDQ